MTDIAHQIRRLAERNRKRDTKEPIWLSGYSDASFNPSTRQGGFGAWLRDHQQRIIVSGPTPNWAKDNNLAELCAVFGALYTGMTKFDCSQVNIIVVKTDSQAVARWFGWNQGIGRLPQHRRALEIMKMSWEMAEERSLRMVVTWVKGHQKKTTTEAWLNDRVDTLAKEARLSRENSLWRQPISAPLVLDPVSPEKA